MSINPANLFEASMSSQIINFSAFSSEDIAFHSMSPPKRNILCFRLCNSTYSLPSVDLPAVLALPVRIFPSLSVYKDAVLTLCEPRSFGWSLRCQGILDAIGQPME